MREIILIKLGEMVLKGLNRKGFDSVLRKNIARRLKAAGRFDIREAQSTIYITPAEGEAADMDAACGIISKIFGLASFTRACEVEKDLSAIMAASETYLGAELSQAATFKVECKRSDKRFPLKSPEICAQVGGFLLSKFHGLKVDVENPDFTVYVEIRDFAAYVHGTALRGAGGIPVGTGGKACVLISGGIDSPVAAWMMAKRGVELTAVHFASPPYTSERAEQKAVDLLRRVGRYAGSMTMYTVPFAKIQEEIKEKCPQDIYTVIMRRFMMKAAQAIALKEGCSALVTGESLGQVASQTIQAIACTNAAAGIPVLRPLIGMDKIDIINIANKIDTYELSILPYEDCCTIFTPKHPRTRPVLKYVLKAEEALDCGVLLEDCLSQVKTTKIYPDV